MQAASRQAASLPDAELRLPNPACVPGAGQRCEHALVDALLNERLYDYECRVRARFERIVPTLKALSALQHEADFVERAQRIALDNLGYELPEPLLAKAWVAGLDLRQLHSHCVFRSFRECIQHADEGPFPCAHLAAQAVGEAHVHRPVAGRVRVGDVGCEQRLPSAAEDQRLGLELVVLPGDVRGKAKGFHRFGVNAWKVWLARTKSEARNSG